MEQETNNEATVDKELDEQRPNENGQLAISGHIKIFDPNSGEVIVDKRNAIHYENISEALANSLANKTVGQIYSMAFGNGGSSVDPTGVITYLPPNTTGQNANLYNPTYSKVVDDNSSANTDTSRNNLTVTHTTGKVYTDILVSCLLDYGEPSGQQAFDNSTDFNGDYVFDELGLKTWNGSATELRLITHVIFHPVQKSLNRQIQIDYTVRIQTLTNLSAT
jgi:hypothetical protein|tara:strand:- start:1111 stop:1773 length:663 start_codon:yes stop_codon:yes gene_type:complete